MHLKDYILPIGKRTCVMGILNVTPDSFSDGGMYADPVHALARAKQMADEGADIIDIGGESSRPGAEKVSENEELRRVIPVIKALKGIINVPISIDTYKREVARTALAEGALIVNDITALRYDSAMAGTIAEFDAAVIIMHMKGTPAVMQEEPVYDDVVEEVLSYLSDSIVLAENAGIKPEKIIVDPGIGFGKTVEHNITILRELERFKKLNKPVLIGTSRKSFIGELTGRKVEERMFGTAASFSAAIMNGADVIRAHDVSAMCDVARITDAIIR